MQGTRDIQARGRLSDVVRGVQAAIMERVRTKLTASGSLVRSNAPGKTKSVTSPVVDVYREEATGSVVDEAWVAYRQRLIRHRGWSWRTPSRARSSNEETHDAHVNDSMSDVTA